MAVAPPSSPDSTRPPPRMVGRYALYGELARGGMATVHFGRLLGPVGFSRTVAIKRLHPQYASDAEFVAMFLDEARLAARIQHPNVVSTIDVVALEGELMLVMEYVQGESLSRLLSSVRARNERVPWRVVAAVANGILAGLHAAHEAKNERGEPLGIVHRDMSPQNVLVGADGGIRVFDFGIAKAAGRASDTRQGLFKGKLAYAAPEQLAGSEIDRRVDVYAASVVLWEIVTGRRMFKADNELLLYAMVKEGRIDPPSVHASDLPAGLEAIILRGLANDPQHRFGSAREMAMALEELFPHASAREVAEWVAHVARDALKTRARRVEEIETTNIDLLLDSGVRDLETLIRQGPASGPGSGPSSQRTNPSSGLPSQRTGTPSGPGSAPPLSGPVSGLAATLPGVYPHTLIGDGEDQGAQPTSTYAEAPPPKKRRGLLFALLLLVLASAAFGVVFALRAPPPAPTTEEPQVETASKSKKPLAKAAAKPAEEEPVVADPAPTAAVAKPEPAAPKVEAKPASPTSKAAAPAKTAASAVPASPPAAAAANCTPPFNIDSDGIRHPKPECM